MQRSNPTHNPIANARGTSIFQGFTLIELMVSIGIIVLLLAVLIPSVRFGYSHARGFRCQLNQRDLAFEFSVFADDNLHGNRGEDDAGAGRFNLENFIENQYGVSEFWRYGDMSLATRDSAEDPLRCSEVRGPIVLRRNVPCRQGAVSPTQNISFTFNKRLYTPEIKGHRGMQPTQVWLTSVVLQNPNVPFVWDLDGAEAAARDIVPHFTAPGLDSQTEMANDAYWVPSMRHSGKGNFALLDGSVHQSATPLSEGWNWAYQPRR